MSNKLKVFVVYGNMKLDFKTLSDIILNTFDPSFDVTIQLGYSKNVFNNNYKIFDFCDSLKFKNYIKGADLIISHAGVGVISECLKVDKKPFVVCRRSKLNEHINDHQYDFCSTYLEDNLFTKVENSIQLKNFITINKYLEKPSRNFITNLEGMKNVLYDIIDEELNK